MAKKYSKDINKEMEDVEKYYDDMSNDYENVVRSWGYNMPESVAEALEIHGNLTKDNVWSMLDIGCGDGLFGAILKVMLVGKTEKYIPSNSPYNIRFK